MSRKKWIRYQNPKTGCEPHPMGQTGMIYDLRISHMRDFLNVDIPVIVSAYAPCDSGVVKWLWGRDENTLQIT